MSLTKVSIVSASGETVELPIGSSMGYQLEEITGLDHVKADITSSDYGASDGARYQSSRRGSRNIVMRIGLIPDYVTNSVQSLRLGLGNRAAPKSRVTLRFHDSDGTVLRTDGHVESFESPLFVQDPKAWISIICLDPDFVAEVQTSHSLNSVVGVTPAEVGYLGSAATGFLLEMTMNRATNEIALVVDTAEGETMRMDFAMALASGDKLEINSVFGQKGVWVTKTGVRTSALAATTPVSKFPVLTHGINDIRVQMAGAAIPYTIKYYARHGSL